MPKLRLHSAFHRAFACSNSAWTTGIGVRSTPFCERLCRVVTIEGVACAWRGIARMRRRAARTVVLALSPSHAHMAGDGGALVAAIDNEIVPLRLAADRLVDRGKEQVVGLRGAQRLTQIGRVFLAEAHIERAGAGHPHAIAGLAEIMGERGN